MISCHSHRVGGQWSLPGISVVMRLERSWMSQDSTGSTQTQRNDESFRFFGSEGMFMTWIMRRMQRMLFGLLGSHTSNLWFWKFGEAPAPTSWEFNSTNFLKEIAGLTNLASLSLNNPLITPILLGDGNWGSSLQFPWQHVWWKRLNFWLKKTCRLWISNMIFSNFCGRHTHTHTPQFQETD